MRREKGLIYLEKEDLEKLPEEIRQSILRTLKAYDETEIVYEYGKYKEMPATVITATYAEDYKYIGIVRAKDIYTIEERIKNYEETFKCKCYFLRNQLKSSKEERGE